MLMFNIKMNYYLSGDRGWD